MFIPQSYTSLQSQMTSSAVQQGKKGIYRPLTTFILWEPNAIFDDRLLCIQCQNKNQDNTNLNIDSLIANEMKSQMKGRPIDGLNFNNQALPPYNILNENNSGIKVYPNPASTFIIINIMKGRKAI